MKYIAGPCVIESEEQTLEIAHKLKNYTQPYPDIELYFKASFDKANRTKHDSYRGPGLEEGLEILTQVKKETGLKILTDIHEPHQAEPTAKVADVIQIPAFLARQTDLIAAAANTGKVINLKKPQFVSATAFANAVAKARHFQEEVWDRPPFDPLWVTERGTIFGYDNLVVDFRNLSHLRSLSQTTIFDATHSIQGQYADRSHIIPLCRAAVAYGVDGIFTEVHPRPARALSDSANCMRLDEVPRLLEELVKHST